MKKYNCDIVSCNRKRIQSPSDIYIYNHHLTNDISIYNEHEYAKLLKDYRNNIHYVAIGRLLISKELALKATKYYNKKIGVTYWEDAIFSYFVYFNARSLACIDGDPLYYYVYNDQSVTNKRKNILKYCDDCFTVTQTLFEIIKTSGYHKHFRQSAIYSVFAIIEYVLNNEKYFKSFSFIAKRAKRFLRLSSIKVLEKEYTPSERIFAFSIKFNVPILSFYIWKKNKRAKQ